MKRLPSEESAMANRDIYPGSFALYTDARRYGALKELRRGMPMEDARDAVSRAEYAYRAARAATHCAMSGVRAPVGDYKPTTRKLKANSPEFVGSLNAIVAMDDKLQVKALATLKRTLSAFPTCKFGGELTPAWDTHGACTWQCSRCGA